MLKWQDVAKIATSNLIVLYYFLITYYFHRDSVVQIQRTLHYSCEWKGSDMQMPIQNILFNNHKVGSHVTPLTVYDIGRRWSQIQVASMNASELVTGFYEVFELHIFKNKWEYTGVLNVIKLSCRWSLYMSKWDVFGFIFIFLPHFILSNWRSHFLRNNHIIKVLICMVIV